MNNRTSLWEILVKENNKALLEGDNNSFSPDQIKRLTTIGKNMNISVYFTDLKLITQKMQELIKAFFKTHSLGHL